MCYFIKIAWFSPELQSNKYSIFSFFFQTFIKTFNNLDRWELVWTTVKIEEKGEILKHIVFGIYHITFWQILSILDKFCLLAFGSWSACIYSICLHCALREATLQFNLVITLSYALVNNPTWCHKCPKYQQIKLEIFDHLAIRTHACVWCFPVFSPKFVLRVMSHLVFATIDKS